MLHGHGLPSEGDTRLTCIQLVPQPIPWAPSHTSHLGNSAPFSLISCILPVMAIAVVHWYFLLIPKFQEECGMSTVFNDEKTNEAHFVKGLFLKELEKPGLD
jgi:hypothetical protein